MRFGQSRWSCSTLSSTFRPCKATPASKRQPIECQLNTCGFVCRVFRLILLVRGSLGMRWTTYFFHILTGFMLPRDLDDFLARP